MSLASLLTDVYSLTNRPDLVAETTLAIKNATLKAHRSDSYPRDIFEYSFACATEDYLQSVEYSALIPRWRALSYLNRIDNAGVTVGPPLRVITPDSALDDYAQTRLDVVYLAGLYLKIRTATPWQYFTVGCFRDPDVTDANYSSWVADTQPSVIQYEAAKIVFKTIGDDAKVATYEALVQEALRELRAANIQLQG